MTFRSLACMMIAAALCLAFPWPALAQVSYVDMGDICTNGVYPHWALTTKIVVCLQASIIAAVSYMLIGMSNYLFPITSIVLTFSVATFGIRILAGERHILGEGAKKIMRLVLVSIFSYNLGGLGPAFFYIEDNLLSLATGGYSPWSQIDVFLGKLVGYGPNIVLFQGMLGLIGSALFSNSIGALLFFSGFMAIINLLMFIFNVLYTYISALIIMGFMIVISPLMITLAAIFYTERYFNTWLQILLSAMLMPVLLFGFLWMFLNIFDVLIQGIYDGLGGNDFRAFWKSNQPVFSWLMPSDPNLHQQLQGIAATTPNSNVNNTPAVQSFLNPNLFRAFNANMTNFPGVNFGSNNPQVVQGLSNWLILIFLFAYLMNSLLHKIPSVAASIAGVQMRVPMFAATPQERINEGMDNLKTGTGALLGGRAGSEIGGAMGKQFSGAEGAAHGRSVGGIVGMAAGAMTFRKL